MLRTCRIVAAVTVGILLVDAARECSCTDTCFFPETYYPTPGGCLDRFEGGVSNHTFSDCRELCRADTNCVSFETSIYQDCKLSWSCNLDIANLVSLDGTRQYYHLDCPIISPQTSTCYAYGVSLTTTWLKLTDLDNAGSNNAVEGIAMTSGYQKTSSSSTSLSVSAGPLLKALSVDVSVDATWVESATFSESTTKTVEFTCPAQTHCWTYQQSISYSFTYGGAKQAYTVLGTISRVEGATPAGIPVGSSTATADYVAVDCQETSDNSGASSQSITAFIFFLAVLS